MEKRKLISLRAVLLGYLVQTAVSCIVAAVLWLLLFFLCIDSGWLLPANRAARVSNEAAQNILPYRTAKTFDPAELDPLCRYVLIDAEGNTCLPQHGQFPSAKGNAGVDGGSSLGDWIRTVLSAREIAGRDGLSAAI